MIMENNFTVYKKDVISDCKKVIDEFNNNRKPSEYQKIKKIISSNDQLSTIINRINYSKKVIQDGKGLKAFLDSAEQTNPIVDKTNQQILFLEDSFEKQRKLNVKRPSIKERVLSQLSTGIANNGFIEKIR